MNSWGRPCGSTSLTGTIVSPKPWVKTIRWLTHDPAWGLRSGASSRARQHHLAGLVVDRVAVDVDVVEVVVLAHRLELVERRLERPVVPQAGVL